MENQESSANVKVPFDVEALTANDINMEDIVITSTQQCWQSQSSNIPEKMNKSQIITLALNLLSTDSRIRSTGIHIPEMKHSFYVNKSSSHIRVSQSKNLLWPLVVVFTTKSVSKD